MTDLPASWRSDPTGRHDHRYWDGTRWTDHVADAGVASTDPYTEPPAAPDAEPPSIAADASSEPASALSWDPHSPTSVAGAGASEPDTGAGDATAATPSGWSRPSEPTTPEPDGSTESAPIAGWASSPSSGWSTDRTEVTPAATAAAATTEVTPIVDAAPVPDPSVAPGAPGPDGDAAGPVPPIGPDPDAGSSGSRRNVVIALGVLAVVAVVAFLALSGDDDDLSSSAISNRLSESLQADSDLSDDDADCVADHIVERVGPERLGGVDFTSDTAPEGEVGSDFVEAYADAVRECDVRAFAVDDGGDGGDPDPGVTIPDVGDLDSFRDQLADQYEQMLGLTREKADCLADAMGEAVSKGELDEQDAFGDFFEYLERCDISFSELTDA